MAIPAAPILLAIADAAKIVAAGAPLIEQLLQGGEPTREELEKLFDDVEASRLSRELARRELRDVIDQMPDD